MEPTLMSFVRRIGHAYVVFSQDVLQEYGFNRTSLGILLFIAEHADHCTARDISAHKNLKANVISTHVDKLVSEGYVVREAIEGDRRKVRLVCTDKAMPIVNAGRTMRSQFEETLFNGFTPEERQAAWQLISRIESNAQSVMTSNTTH